MPPLVPKFSIAQNEDFVLITINVPHIRVSSAEVIADGYDFSFYCNPYLLKLTFACEFHEDDERCKAVYDPELNNGTLVAHLPKKNIGEVFPDLDLTTNLMRQRKEKELASTDLDGIEVLNSQDCDISSDDNQSERANFSDAMLLNTTSAVPYGFNLRYSKVLCDLRDELVDMLEIRDPDRIPLHARRAMRIQSENSRFDVQRYLGDYFDGESDPLYAEAMSHEPFWITHWNAYKALDKDDKANKAAAAAAADKTVISPNEEHAAVSAHTDDKSGVNTVSSNTNASSTNVNNKDRSFDCLGGFTAAEREALSSGLKHREYLIARGSAEESAALLTLADILFAYCYDVRTTVGEEANVESAANIARLSSALSWLDPFLDSQRRPDDVSSVIKFSLRRSVILPYLRVWKLSRKVLTDVAKVLLLGKRTVLRCLLHVRRVFERTDTHYLLNKLFVDDLCVWIQALDDGTLQRFARDYNAAKTAVETSCPGSQGRELMGLHLPELEKWAEQQQRMCEEDDEEEDEEESSDEENGSSSSDSEEDDDGEGDSDIDSDDDSEGGAGKGEATGEDDTMAQIPKRLLRYDNEHYKTSPDLSYLYCEAQPASFGGVVSSCIEQNQEPSTAAAAGAVSRLLAAAGGVAITDGADTSAPMQLHELRSLACDDAGLGSGSAADVSEAVADGGKTNKRVLIEVLDDATPFRPLGASGSDGDSDHERVGRTSNNQLFMKEVTTTRRKGVKAVESLVVSSEAEITKDMKNLSV